MENPHAERQAVLLERILKNTVCTVVLAPSGPYLIKHAVEMHRDDIGTQSLYGSKLALLCVSNFRV